jgi:hypothetical protein
MRGAVDRERECVCVGGGGGNYRPLAIEQWYSTFFVRVSPDVISLQFCTPQSWCIIQVIQNLHLK